MTTRNDHLRAPPAYEQYASDLLANEHYRLMSLSERGLLETLRLQCWVSGSIPKDCPLLSRLTGIPEGHVSETLTARVLSFFESSSSERLVCPELLKQRERMDERRAERTRSGRKGAKAKWGTQKRALAEPMAQPSSAMMASAEQKRTELSREDTSRKASLGNPVSIALSPASKGWVNEYDQSEGCSADQYRKASRG